MEGNEFASVSISRIVVTVRQRAVTVLAAVFRRLRKEIAVEIIWRDLAMQKIVGTLILVSTIFVKTLLQKRWIANKCGKDDKLIVTL